MQHTQLNFVRTGTICVLVFVLVGVPGWAGTMVQRSPPDSLLDGGDTIPCAAQPDYAAGTDATGRAVAPADIGAAPVPVPDGIAVPLHSQGSRRGRFATAGGDSAYVSLDGRKLAPLLNPTPCR